MSTYPTSSTSREYPIHFGEFTAVQRRQFVQSIDDKMKSYGAPVPEPITADKIDRYSNGAEGAAQELFKDYLGGTYEDGERVWPDYWQAITNTLVEFGAKDTGLAWNQISQDLVDDDPFTYNIYGRGDVCDTMTQGSGQCDKPQEQLDEGNLSQDQPSVPTAKGSKALQTRRSKLHRAIRRFKSGLSRKGAADLSSRDSVANE